MSKKGAVYLVGAGCGDYDLITLRGKNLLEACDVVVYDSLIDSRLMNFVHKNAEKICVGKRAGRHSESQKNINKLIIDKAKQGKTVVRLKGGDPFVFGRGGEEILALQNEGIEYSIVPGISSSIAVPELAGIPVTHRNVSRSVHIITGHTSSDELPETIGLYANLDGTLVFLMGLHNVGLIAEGLIKNGKNENTPSAVISNGAGRGQRVVRSSLKNIAGEVKREKLQAPAVIVIGEVAEFDFSETVSKPLENTSVAVTGTKGFVEKLSAKLNALGAVVEALDYLEIEEYRDHPELDNALADIQKYRWLVFTSANGVKVFWNRLQRLELDIRKLSHIKFAAVGSGTAQALKQLGIYADLIPEPFTASALAERLSQNAGADGKILILRAKSGSLELNRILEENKVGYDDIKTYEISNKEIKSENKMIAVDYITFASSSGVACFFENHFMLSPNTKIVCIGAPTAKTLKKFGISKYIAAKTNDADGIVDAIIREAEH